MKIITLHQPWASMLVTNKPGTDKAIKGWETRGWHLTDERILHKLRTEGLLIHAGLSWNSRQKKVITQWPFKQYMPELSPLPFGKIVGHVRIGEIIRTEEWMERYEHNPDYLEEYKFGNYNSLRRTFEIKRFTKFTNQASTPGFQKIFNFDERICLSCGCTEENCKACIQKTGSPCHWINKQLCSACI